MKEKARLMMIIKNSKKYTYLFISKIGYTGLVVVIFEGQN